MRISYDHDIDAFLAGSRGQLIERILGEERVAQDRGVFQLDAPIDRLSDALFRYGRALTRIYDLTLHSRSRATSTFYDDLADLLFQTVDEERILRDHLLPDLPNAEAYPIDYRMEGKSGGQVFLYGVPNRDKARLTTIILSHFHRNHLDFDSILVFSDPGRDSPDGPGEAVGCGRGHALVAGVAGGLPAEGGEAGWVGGDPLHRGNREASAEAVSFAPAR